MVVIEEVACLREYERLTPGKSKQKGSHPPSRQV